MKKAKKYHCELCKFFGFNGTAISWTYLTKKEKSFLKNQGWNKRIYNKFMNWVDHSPSFIRYAKNLIKEHGYNT